MRVGAGSLVRPFHQTRPSTRPCRAVQIWSRGVLETVDPYLLEERLLALGIRPRRQPAQQGIACLRWPPPPSGPPGMPEGLRLCPLAPERSPGHPAASGGATQQPQGSLRAASGQPQGSLRGAYERASRFESSAFHQQARRVLNAWSVGPTRVIGPGRRRRLLRYLHSGRRSMGRRAPCSQRSNAAAHRSSTPPACAGLPSVGPRGEPSPRAG